MAMARDTGTWAADGSRTTPPELAGSERNGISAALALRGWTTGVFAGALAVVGAGPADARAGGNASCRAADTAGSMRASAWCAAGNGVAGSRVLTIGSERVCRASMGD